jgi:hypothetical protein
MQFLKRFFLIFFKVCQKKTQKDDRYLITKRLFTFFYRSALVRKWIFKKFNIEIFSIKKKKYIYFHTSELLELIYYFAIKEITFLTFRHK